MNDICVVFGIVMSRFYRYQIYYNILRIVDLSRVKCDQTFSNFQWKKLSRKWRSCRL